MALHKNIRLFENHPSGLTITSQEGKIIDTNLAMIQIFGFNSREELLSANVTELYYDSAEREVLLKELRKGPVKNFKLRGKHQSGRMIWLSISSDQLVDENGTIEYIDIVDDITEQIIANEKIAQYSRLFHDSVNEIYIFDAETYRFIECNKAAANNLGYSEAEFLAMAPTDIQPNFTPESFTALISPLLSGTKEKIVFVSKLKRKDGSLYPCEVHLQKSRFHDRDTFTAIVLDITEKLNAEKALKDTEEKYKAIVEDQTEFIYRWKPDGTRIFVNKRYADYYGQPANKLVGTSFVDTINPEAWKNLSARIQALTPENPISIHEHLTTYQGNEIWKEWTDRAFFDTQGKLVEIQSVGRDITSRKNAELRLQENQALLLASLISIGEGILVVSNSGKIVHHNPAFLKLWKIPEALIEKGDDNTLLNFVINQLKYPEAFLNKVMELYQTDRIDYDILEFADGRHFERRSYPLLYTKSIEGRVWSFRDVSEQFRIQEQIKESEARFKQLIEHLPDAIFVCEIGGPNRGKIYDVNKAAEIQTGYSREELLTKNIGDDLIEQSNFEQFENDEKQLLQNGILRLSEKKKRKDGTTYWVEVMIATISQGGKTMALSVNRDITELKKSETELKESRQNLLMIYETAGVNLIHIGVENQSVYRILSVNSMYLQTSGKKLSEVENKRIEEVFDADTCSLARAKYTEAIEGRTTVKWEEAVVYPSGKKWGAVSATPVFDDFGQCIGIIQVIHDITEKKEIEANIIRSQEELEKLVQSRTLDLERSRKAALNLLQDSNVQRKIAEEALEKLEESNTEIRKLSQAVEQNPAAVVIIDTHGFVEYANRFYLEKTGFEFSEIAGENPEKEIFSNSLPARRKDIWETISQGKTWRGEIQNRKKDGQIFWESISISPLMDENQSILGYIRVGQDISQRKKLEEDLLIAKEKADEATRAKSEFLANMSHEIRTPMNAILGFAELLSIKVTEANAKNYIQSLKTSGKSLLNLINDILDLSKVDAGMLHLNYDFIDLKTLFSEIRQMFQIELTQKKLQFSIEIDPTLPAGIFLDEIRLRQVLINLVNNAIKFTDQGTIILRARSDRNLIIKPEQKNFTIGLIIEVQDTGVGVTDDFQKIIFDSFTQHEGHDTKRFGGTGLGLAISQKLIRLMGGHLTLQSKLGQGSTFTITLENTMVTTLPIHKEKKEMLSLGDIIFDPAKILVVDDNRDNLNLLTSILEQAGLIISTAGNGKEAVEEIRNNLPVLVITDIKMPEMNGLELLRFIRKSDQFRNIPVLCSSASTLNDSESNSDELYFDGYLSKPIQLPELLTELKKHISHKIIRSSPKEPLKPDYFIGGLNNKTALAVTKIIDTELMPLYDQIKHRQPVKKVEQFGNLLIISGQKLGLDGLTNYGNDIIDSLKSFNIEGIVRLIKLFPEIIEPIKTSKTEI